MSVRPSVVVVALRNSVPTSSVTSRVSHRRESAPAGTGPCTMFLTRCVRAADALPSTMLCSYSCGGHPRPNWCKSKDAPQTERNAIDAQNEGAHRADFSAPPALGAKLCAQRDLSALFWRLLPQAFWFCHPAQKQQRRAFLQSLRGSMASAFAPPPPPPPADSADSAPVQDGKQKTLPFFATRISVLGQNYKKAAALRAACAPFCFAFKACVHNGIPRVLSQGPDAPVPKRARTTPPPPPLPLPATTNSE